MTQTKQTAKPGRMLPTLGRVLGYMLQNYKFSCFMVVVCVIGSALASVQGILFTQTLIDGYIAPMLQSGAADYGPLAAALLRVAALYAAGILCAYGYNRIMVNVSQGTMRSIRTELFTHMESLPIRYFDTHAHGDIMSVYTNDVDTLRQLISQSIPQLINSLVTIVTSLASMILLDLPLTVITVAMICVMLAVSSRVAGRSSRYFTRQQSDLGKVNGYIEEMMDGQKVVKVFCHEEESIAGFRALNEQLRDSADKANTYASITMPLNANLGNISYVLCAMVGALLALHGYGGLTLGALVSFLTLNKSGTQPVSQVSMQTNSIVMAAAGAERIFALMDETPETNDGYVTLVNAREKADGSLEECAERTGTWAWKHPHRDGTLTYTKLEGDITFHDVDFGYDPGKIVLHNIELFATPGQKIAFVGSTGAGKTTITNLINRFYDIADGFIRRLPDGYQTMLTGDGANLSQGQRQLLAIARAAVADPPVLILDEATSSIDTRTEALVQAGMDALMTGRTTFVIAHRLSTVKNADCIMVLEQGRIIERGTHDQLIEKKGRYYQLYTGNAIGA
ncbi:MAG TPA: ABC transporter ATP-binding protein/permease [Candidatus Faecalibacterium faecipullorum]|uniref:ABC transporter ATP-binding protein/permease n=1 Tax=Candidatus Faecalibacterium faecipullorum TaxID=2838578 RepID=A0A9D2MDM2_9FIRM|nr:ABC transporter ATP-binding protein/permease [Candidatus Faecalibacterium faecipullorum]